MFSRGVRIRLVFLLWLTITIFYVYVASRYVSTRMTDDEFEAYLVNIVDTVGTQRRPAEDLHELVLLRARDLELPIGPADIRVERDGRKLDLFVSYAVVIDVPVVVPGGYRQEFNHEVSYRPPR